MFEMPKVFYDTPISTPRNEYAKQDFCTPEVKLNQTDFLAEF